jgi:death-on-curing protein
MVRIECDTNLNAKKIIEMHNDIIKDFGGEPGLRDLATLEYVVFRVNRSRNSFRNAAIALHGIATGYPFIEGNKRLLLLLQKIFWQIADITLMHPGWKSSGSWCRLLNTPKRNSLLKAGYKKG